MKQNDPFSGPGFTFTTYKHNQTPTANQENDAYITIEFNPKSTVDQVTYTKGSLKGTNGLDVETQSVTPVLE